MTMNPDQEQMVWLIDFQQWTMSSISVKAARETANILQNHYPERLGLAILYNPPKVFESFWMVCYSVAITDKIFHFGFLTVGLYCSRDQMVFSYLILFFSLYICIHHCTLGCAYGADR